MKIMGHKGGNRLVRQLFVALLVMALPFGLVATPASASTYNGKCTVDPKNPVFGGHTKAGFPLVKYKYRIDCDGGRKIQIWQKFYEKDPDVNQLVGEAKYAWLDTGLFGYHDTKFTLDDLPDTDPAGPHGDEEMFQTLSFRVWVDGVYGEWTTPERSGSVAMPN